MKLRPLAYALCLLLALVLAGYVVFTRVNTNPSHQVGDMVDSYRGVAVYYNGGVQHVEGRNISAEGYNLGLSWQCVEFVKRYYYERFGHKMPDDKGHAKDFFDARLPDGAVNAQRDLLQFRNGAGTLPVEDDLVVFAPWLFNRYGHVAIVSAVGPDYIEVIQQNPGPFGSSRERYPLLQVNGAPQIGHARALGWLRLKPAACPTCA